MRRPAVGEASDGLVPGEPGLLRGGQVEGRHGEAVRRSARLSWKGLEIRQNTDAEKDLFASSHRLNIGLMLLYFSM